MCFFKILHLSTKGEQIKETFIVKPKAVSDTFPCFFCTGAGSWPEVCGVLRPAYRRGGQELQDCGGEEYGAGESSWKHHQHPESQRQAWHQIPGKETVLRQACTNQACSFLRCCFFFFVFIFAFIVFCFCLLTGRKKIPNYLLLLSVDWA